MKSLLVLLFFVVVLVRCDDGEQSTTLPYSVTPPNARLQAPCWRDIDGSERVAIFFDHAMMIDRVLLAGEESVGFRVRSRSLYLEPSFVQRLEYQCKGETTQLSAQQVNASFTCKDFFESFPPLSAAIPLECYNSTYVYLADILLVHGSSPTQCAQLIDMHCVATHSTVSNTTCPAVFQYTNGITNCDVSCRCAYFQPTVGIAPSLGATPPPTPFNCTAYFINTQPPFDPTILAACNVTLTVTNCVPVSEGTGCVPPPLGTICKVDVTNASDSEVCCFCIIFFTGAPTLQPTVAPTPPPTTALNCTEYLETQPFPFNETILEECRVIAIEIFNCVPLNTTNNCSGCATLPPTPGKVCRAAVNDSNNCCLIIIFADTVAPTPQPTPSPTTLPTSSPTSSPTSRPTPSPTSQPTSSPTASPPPTTTTSSPTAAPTPSPTAPPQPTTTPSPTTTPVPTESSSPTTAAPTSSGSGSGFTTGEIIAIIFVVIVVMTIICLFIALLCIRRNRGTLNYVNRS